MKVIYKKLLTANRVGSTFLAATGSNQRNA